MIQVRDNTSKTDVRLVNHFGDEFFVAKKDIPGLMRDLARVFARYWRMEVAR